MHREEPVTLRAPSFSTETTSVAFTKHQGQSFALLCQAQAFPVPLIRLVYVIQRHSSNSDERECDKMCNKMGSKASSFTNFAQNITSKHVVTTAFSFLCAAQAHFYI